MYTLAATSASSSLQWLATITSHLALKAARSCGAEELGRVERGLVHHHRHTLGIDALHYALHARRAEVAAARLRGEAVPPTVGASVPECTSSATRESTWSATKSLRVRLAPFEKFTVPPTGSAMKNRPLKPALSKPAPSPINAMPEAGSPNSQASNYCMRTSRSATMCAANPCRRALPQKAVFQSAFLK